MDQDNRWHLGDLAQTDPEFVERLDGFMLGEVPEAVGLDDVTRYLGWMATLLGCQGIDEFRAVLPRALARGITPATAKEVVYQAVAYLGIGRVRPFLDAVNEAIVAAGLPMPVEPRATTQSTVESRLAGGEQAQVACFGEGMRGYKDRGNPDYPQINRWLVDNCFGDWYAREGLTIPQRELVTFCWIAAQGGCEAQLRAHTAGNLHVGNSRELLIRVIESNLPLIGYPRTLNALAVVDEVCGPRGE